METTAPDRGPAVTRLCIATLSASGRGPLTSIQRSGGFYRLYLAADPAAGTEFAVASPGIDVVSLVADVIDALHAQVKTGPRQHWPVLASFHVGITRLLGDSFGGEGAHRASALIRHPAILAASAPPAEPGPDPDAWPAAPVLGVAVTAVLFEELRAEGLPSDGWKPVPAAGAWLKLFGGLPR